jgi:hypothetical protein
MAQHTTSPFRGGYTLYTVEDVPFGTFPAYPEGPAMVISGAGYYVSTTTNDQEPGARVGAFKVVSERPYRTERHPLDGVSFPDSEAARKAQYEAGLLAYMVYDDSEWARQMAAARQR